MTTREKVAQAGGGNTPVWRLLELIEDPDIVVSIKAMTHPKIEQFGPEAWSQDFRNFHRAVEQWILASQEGINN